jgi:hypothetical protein
MSFAIFLAGLRDSLRNSQKRDPVQLSMSVTESPDIPKLYHLKWSSSCRVVNFIFELGLEKQVQITVLPDWEQKQEWYRKLHPQAKVRIYIFDWQQ